MFIIAVIICLTYKSTYHKHVWGGGNHSIRELEDCKVPAARVCGPVSEPQNSREELGVVVQACTIRTGEADVGR